jgi:dihydrofolate reductase
LNRRETVGGFGEEADMRKVLMTMYMTLDGVAEWPEYEDAPAADSEEEDQPLWSARMASIDTLLLGRQTYLKWASYWPARKDDPSSSPFMKAFSRFADRAEKVVFSKTLPSVEWANSRIVRGDVGEEITRLKSLPGKDMAVLGPRLAQSFLDRDLVDELFLEVYRSLVGKGKPLFHVVPNPDNPEDRVPLGAPGRHDFTLAEAKPLKDGTVFLHYRRADRPPTGT